MLGLEIMCSKERYNCANNQNAAAAPVCYCNTAAGILGELSYFCDL